jgi:signal transduction histidine kinase
MFSSLLERLARLSRAAGFRLALWYSAFITVSCLVFFGLAYYSVSSLLAARDRENILFKFWDLAAIYQEFGKEGLQTTMSLQEEASGAQPKFVQFTEPGADAPTEFFRDKWTDFRIDSLVDLGKAAGEQWVSIPSRAGGETLEVMSLRLSDGLVLQVGQTDAERREVLVRFRRSVSLIMVLAILISLPGGYLLARRAMRPVRELIATIKRIEAGALGERVQVGRNNDEFDELGRLFNLMLGRVETLIAGMKGALDNVAHDLRTPLTRLRMGAEAALASKAGLAQSREALADCVEESDRVVSMVETLMDISEAETGLMRLKLEDVDLSGLVEEVVELYRDSAEGKGLAIDFPAPEPASVRADRNRLRQVVANLIDNAVKYTPSGGRIRLETFCRGGEAVLIVADTGPGIPAVEIPKVWERLYRGDSSRSERGLGLGLSLVKAVVLAHRGRVDVQSDSLRGSRFSCFLPTGAA